eukprot:365214-Chlamydomonas_euryale.AAC.13
MALMGPSGCGKSSLLQVLGGRTTARPRGAIGYNGKKLTKAMKRSIGFVSQDDILYGSLTVFEVRLGTFVWSLGRIGEPLCSTMQAQPNACRVRSGCGGNGCLEGVRAASCMSSSYC